MAEPIVYIDRSNTRPGLEIRSWQQDLGLYPALLHPLLERSLHMVAVLVPPRRGA